MRKKTHLTLYKRFKRYAPSKLSTPTKSPSKKRQRVSTSHQTPSKSIKKSSTSPSYVASKLQSPWKHPPSASKWIDVETENNENTEEDCKHLNTFKRELENYGLWQYFKLFIDLVSKQMYPLDNIAMLLFLDTVKFFGSKSTTCMKYFPETKRFWKSGYRLFHAKFLYYMGGPKNVGVKEENQRDHIDPSAARINFAVPSINVIEEFVVSESSTSMSKKMPAGVIEPIIESIQMSVQDKRFMLCADAKKVTAGIDRQGGDVDLFGFEDGETLAERQKRLSNELQSLKEIEEKVTSETNLPKPDLAAKLRESVTMIGKRIQEARDLKSRQEFGLNKFVALGGEKWRESKYIYAISALHTSLYRLNEFLSTALSTSYRLCRATTLLSKPICSLVDDLVVMKGHQENMIFLNPDLQTDILEPRHTLQRTPTWHAVRKLAPVTGSTIHDAIGLRGLQQQKKHITKISNTNDPEVFPEDVLTRMEYGTINEGNALATLAAIVIPTFFPNCVYVEEGCFLKQGDTKDILMVISPDGSLREFQSDMKSTADTGKVVAAVELKCPYPKENKVLLHYSLPQYYVCQCLAEMYSLGTNRLVYLSWSPESSVVLEVLFDADLFSLIYSFIKETYDTDIPKRPAHAPAQLKKIKLGISKFVKTHVKFLAEVPSAKMYCTDVPITSSSEPYIIPLPRSLPTTTTCVQPETEEIMIAVKNGIGAIELAHDLQRRRATEVMVWVLTHIDRDTKTDLPCSVPIAFGLKDYKLTSGAFRNATNYVINKCQEKGLQICSLSTDGQWIQLMTRDNDGTPLTMLQLQKEVWSKSQKKSKVDICKYISGLNKVKNLDKNVLESVQMEKVNGKIYLQSKDLVVRKIKMPDTEILQRLIVSKKRTHGSEKDIDANSNDTINAENTNTSEWIPEQLITVLQDSNDESVNQVVREIDESLERRDKTGRQDSRPGYGLDDTLDDTEVNGQSEGKSKLSNAGEESYTSDQITLELDSDMEITTLSEEQTLNQPEETNSEYIMEEYSELSSQSGMFAQEQNVQLYDYENLAKIVFESLNESYITDITLESLISMFRSEQFMTLTHKMLDVVISGTLVATGSTEVLRKSWNKTKKSELLKRLLNGGIHPIAEKKTTRRKNVPSLSSLCERVIRSKKMPKSILNTVYASCIFDSEYENWKKKMHSIPLPDILDKSGERSVPFWYSYPEKMNSDVVGKSIDCSHNLTHLRVRSCTTGIGSVTPEAWKRISKTNETKLNPALVEDLIDKQSVPNARTNFSEEVEECMRKYGYVEAASVTKIIRNWYEACDAPGIAAETRIKFLVEMRQFLLSDVSFCRFPPPTRYINKIPIVTFEGMLIDIDTKIQLHWLAGAYNIRSVGSLAAETTVGVLQQLNPVSSVSIKARDVPSVISNVVEVMTCRLNPKRGFHMRTAKRSGVYPTHEADHYSGKKVHPSNVDGLSFSISNHPFDNPKRRTAKRKIRFGTVSGPTAPSRGALPVRQFHRKDESKILPSKRFGIDMLDI